jgi:hypothetical protein
MHNRQRNVIFDHQIYMNIAHVHRIVLHKRTVRLQLRGRSAQHFSLIWRIWCICHANVRRIYTSDTG